MWQRVRSILEDPARRTDVDDRVTYREAAEILGCHVSNVPKLPLPLPA